MKKGLILLGEGFEDTEAIGVIDILRRAGMQIDTAGINSQKIKTQSGNTFFADFVLDSTDLKTYDFLILPGGKAVFRVLEKEKAVDDAITYFHDAGKHIFAICAAPRLLAKKGYFKNQTFTIFPGCLNEPCLGKIVNKGVVAGNKIITAKAMYYVFEFALKIVEKLIDKKTALAVAKEIKGDI